MSRLLIIDDHAIVRTGIKRLLAATPDLECLEASTGEEALAVLAREPVRLVVIDLNLPGLGGVELIRCLLRASPHLHCFCLSWACRCRDHWLP